MKVLNLLTVDFPSKKLFEKSSVMTTSSWGGLSVRGIRCIQCTSCQIHKTEGCTCVGDARNVLLRRKSLVSDPGMHNGTCVMHVPRCMSGSLTRVRGKSSRHSRRMRNLQFYVSGKRPIRRGVNNQSAEVFIVTLLLTQLSFDYMINAPVKLVAVHAILLKGIFHDM